MYKYTHKKTFSEFKKGFYKKVEDLTLFDCGEDVNLIKVVLDGLRVDYLSRGKVRSYLFYYDWIYSCFIFLKRLQVSFLKNKKYSLDKLKKRADAKYVIIDLGRIIYKTKKEPKSLHFENIIHYLKRENVCIIMDKVDDTNLNFDLEYSVLRETFLFKKHTRDDLKLRRDILTTYHKIKCSKLFTQYELKNIQFAFQNFFNQYKVISSLLEELPHVCRAFFVCHYHKEGKLLALKRKKIKCLELQHGLIAPEDVFYVFPSQILPIRDKALFPDKIYVFGNYWKEILSKGHEFNNSQIEIIGDYKYKTKLDKLTEENLVLFKGESKIIIISTQTHLQDHFINYIQILHQHIIENKLAYKIILKIHPSENPSIYKRVLNLPLVFYATRPITEYFVYCDIHISIYSTTLYESLSYNIKNFSLDVPECRDYVQRFIDNNTSQKLGLDEFPFYKLGENITQNSITYYEEFNADILTKRN